MSTLDAMRARCRELHQEAREARVGRDEALAAAQGGAAETFRRIEHRAQERLDELATWLARLEAERREARACVLNVATITERHAVADLRG